MNTSTFFLLFILLFSYSGNEEKQIIQTKSILDKPIMCAEAIGRCTGSVYCNVCTNCSRCGYCKGGGSCGVCGKRPARKRTPTKKKTPAIKYESTNTESTRSNPTSQTNNTAISYTVDAKYKLTERTSLRVSPNSQSTVLYRFKVGDTITLLDSSSEQYWAKVVFAGDIGWVKKHLLVLLKVEP